MVLENPMVGHQYGRTLDRIEDIHNQTKRRSEKTEGIWMFGETGVGKSHYVYSKHEIDDIYVLNLEDNGWWDEYRGQPVVMIDDFRGQVTYSMLLRLADKWPMTVKRRNRAPVQFTSTILYVTSSLKPSEVYVNLAARDSLKQLGRRFKIYEMLEGSILEETVDESAAGGYAPCFST